MDSTEKKILANQKRLKAIKEWQKNKQIVKQSPANSNAKSNCPPNKKTIYDSDDGNDDKQNQLKLFDSDEDDDNFSSCFDIRPQFEGRNGQRMLQMSSELSERFKLDERFKEDEEEITVEKDVEDSEKSKNIRILESILGHEVGKKHPIAQNAKKRKDIERFDPENEKNASCIKEVGSIAKKPKVKKRKSEPEVAPEEIPITSERYIEVTSNLKDIMNTAGTFSFSEKFNRLVDSTDMKNEDERSNNKTDLLQEVSSKNSSSYNKMPDDNSKKNFESDPSFKDPFFISCSDERLKEGVEFFMRSKPLDLIREEWSKKRDRVLDIFKTRRKSARRGFTKQLKNQKQQKKLQVKK